MTNRYEKRLVVYLQRLIDEGAGAPAPAHYVAEGGVSEEFSQTASCQGRRRSYPLPAAAGLFFGREETA